MARKISKKTEDEQAAETTAKRPTRARAAKAEPATPDPSPNPSRRARSKPADAPEPTAAKAEAPPAQKGRGRAAAESEPVSETKAKPRPVRRKPAEAPGDPTMPVPVWRARTSPPAQVDKDETEHQEDDAANLAPRRARTRKRRDRKDAEITAEVRPREEPAAEPRPARNRREERPRQPERPAKVETTAAPETPRRDPVAIRPEAAQVVLRNGVPTLVKDRRVVPPLFFFASATDQHSLETVVDEARMAFEHGVRVVSLAVDLNVDVESVNDAVVEAAYLLKTFSALDPDCFVAFRVFFFAAKGWEKRFPKARFVAEEGGLADASVCDDEFWSEAEECLTSFVRKLKKLDTDGRVFGVHLDRGEWFTSASTGYDTSVAAQGAFRTWLRHRYRNDPVTLRAAWFNGQIDFDTVAVPELGAMSRGSSDFVRTDRKARPWVDYHLFMSDSTCERIAQLAYAAKSASDGDWLVGVSYGYTFEWSHPSSGHLSLGKLLRCPDLDYVAGPPSYAGREPGGTCPFPGPIDSFALNGKLYVSEEDFKVSIGSQREPDHDNPVFKTPQALESAHWRGAGVALAHNSAVAWMDKWGTGWLSSPTIWQRAESIIGSMRRRSIEPGPPPEVAVLVDERSLAYLLDGHAFEALVQNVREAVLRSGLSVGFYLLSDLAHRENFPESRLYVFLNAWDVRPEVRSAIKSRLQRDGKVLFWLYSAGLFEGGRESLERVREVTGIALRPQPFSSQSGTVLLNLREPLCAAVPEDEMSKGGQLEPSYFAIPEDGRVLGEYRQTGLPSYVVREFEDDGDGGWTSVFLGEPIVTPGLFRALGQMAGAHVWNFQNDVVHVRPPFLCVHTAGAGPRGLALPEKWSAFDLLAGEWTPDDGTSLRFDALSGATHLFAVGPRAEIQALLRTDPPADEVLETIEPRGDNTLHWDAMQFDVSIMKLDEWVEENWGDEMADDLLLKPSLLDAPVDEPELDDADQRSRGRRRRRNRRHEGGDGGRREGRERGDDMAVNVLFRKRE
jgi:hypothetical protein